MSARSGEEAGVGDRQATSGGAYEGSLHLGTGNHAQALPGEPMHAIGGG
jgi:hypothetical protein